MNTTPDIHQLGAEILSAIENNELVLYYQPQFDLCASRFAGVEALVRWQHPTRGFLLPRDFLPFIEDTDYIARLGEWVLKTACEINKGWQEKGLRPIRVAVNIAGQQFREKEFVAFVASVLEKTRLKPKFLEIELTENIIIRDDDEKMIDVIHQLKNLGVIITLDDFGTGFSSISYLRKIPVDRIKIDKSYVDNLTNYQDAAIVKAIISLASSLNIEVLAEGVESLKQLNTLMDYECKDIQGFYFSKPVTAKEVEKFLTLHHNDLS